MQTHIETIQKEFEEDFKNCFSSATLESLKIKYLGKKGPIQDLMKGLKEASGEDRPKLGKSINDLKVSIEAKLTELGRSLIAREEQQKLLAEKIDETLPGKKRFQGRKHPVNGTLDEIINILIAMGFTVEQGPDIDTDYYNFEVLNFPPEHPARDMQDTFYINKEVLLRTHTSNIQARVMESQKPPIRIIAPGKCFRNEAVTSRSHVFFHQVEAVYIDKNVSFSDLMGTLTDFMQKLFYKDIKVRFWPNYFPFVEPGLQVDIHCLNCKGSGCTLCKHTGWLEVAGAGMIHPEVLKNGGIDPEEYSGFAWGLGIERLVMLKNGIKDIRLFTENDIRFLNQFSAI
ncbi:phenylalanine--tRNA ligase subunit alpha [Criblamydia sequanensis]|uniref:Phenylalanine--tRNA ligase alpha subunit n=1 Tax=Candidatus Criblamydia sequanensis CRIB-18 TaxID=1437425 RepID=A0A090CY72_9BACT|nr:phenylalanine--tRNA ligase subunit alpha [Criblamydia sequanensis]CDR33357.1 Phenylalanyl-tRNA synthetase alpha chain [Criblamydia sequanensis CRIB-18]